MRFRIFQYLVANHGCNTFFLEDDYANCLRINNYIHGNDDDVEKAIGGLGNWPWITAEMVDVVNWMREYNGNNPDRKLEFIGVDAQKYNANLEKIDELLTKYDMPATDTTIYKPITQTQFFGLKPKKMEPYFDLAASKDVDTKSFSPKDKVEYSNLIRHFKQIIEIQAEKKAGGLRDKTMAINMLEYLKSNSGTKGVFWAHSGHVCTVSLNEFGTDDWGGCAGGYLKEVLGDGYLGIGLDFDEGSFNAWHPDDKSEIIIEKNAYSLGPVTVGPSVDDTFGAYYRSFQSPIFIDFDDIPIEPVLFLQLIGASYMPQEEVTRKSMARYNYLGQNGLDGLILIKVSTPTTLLEE